jgi:hypothetical protein
LGIASRNELPIFILQIKKMSSRNFTPIYFGATVLAFLLTACTAEKGKALPPVPASVKAVQDMVKGKNFTTTATGFYGAITVNDVKEVEWIDTTKEKEVMIKSVVAENSSFKLHFVNDTAVTVTVKGVTYKGTYKADDMVNENEQAGIKLRVTYVDPSFSFGSTEGMEVTYTYLVKGMDEKSLFLELPREVNRKKIVSLLVAD